MSIARRFALPFMVASAVIVLGATAALAQIGPTNPSGGTSCNLTRTEGPSSSNTAGVLSRELSFPTEWRTWLGTFAASHFGYSVTGRALDWRSLAAVVRRPTARR